ncbi:MAG: PD40 domain-containing protein [Desulfarculus sp.]|nr:PD40 domain-containing protein [Desulfarculus sp.]
MTLRACLIVVLTALACLPSPGEALALGQPLSPSPQERQALERAKGKLPGTIVFASRRDGKWRLYRVGADGTGLTRLSTHQANERRPYFCQGGKVLFFQSDRGGRVQVWRSDPSLGGAKLVSPAGRAEWLHGVSEDGKRLLVRTGDQPGDYLLRFLDSGREVAVDFPGWGARQGWVDAVLSPDGRRLGVLFQPREGGQPKQAVYYMEVDDQGRLHGIREVSDGCVVGWRPDSQAFLTCRRTPAGTSLCLASPDGHKERLTEGRQWEYWPAFSPDGQHIVYGASPSDQHDSDTGNYEIYVRRAQGGEPLRLTFHSASDLEPAWGTASGGGQAAPAAELLYEAEAYNHPPGQVVADGQASEGRAVLVPRQSPGGGVIHGQYDFLPAGSYVARFRLRVAAVGGQGPLARLDVARGGGKVLVSREVRPKDLPGGGYADIELAFDLDQPDKDLECRVAFIPGAADLYIDRITVTAAPPGLGGYLKRLLNKSLGRGE